MASLEQSLLFSSCKLSYYVLHWSLMIRSFKHKGLERLFVEDSTNGIRADQAKRSRVILAQLDSADSLRALDLPGLRLHALKGRLAGEHSLTVSGNWRIIFRFNSGDACDVDYVDYH